MTRNKIQNEYFDWMYEKVCGESFNKSITYHRLFSALHQRRFYYSIAMDANREADGESLRYRFGQEMDIDPVAIANSIDLVPCSVLEMMVALAIRCEENIMDDDSYGDRTGQWFWLMIINLGLSNETDNDFDSTRVNRILDRFLDREYKPNGAGGLFVVENPPVDMREIEIWYQMHLYLQDFMDEVERRDNDEYE